MLRLATPHAVRQLILSRPARRRVTRPMLSPAAVAAPPSSPSPTTADFSRAPPSTTVLPTPSAFPVNAHTLVATALSSQPQHTRTLGLASLVAATLFNLCGPLLVAALFQALLSPKGSGVTAILLAYCAVCVLEWATHRVFQEQWSVPLPRRVP